MRTEAEIRERIEQLEGYAERAYQKSLEYPIGSEGRAFWDAGTLLRNGQIEVLRWALEEADSKSKYLLEYTPESGWTKG